MHSTPRFGAALFVGVALLAVGFTGAAAAGPGASVSADGDGAEMQVTGEDVRLDCTFETDGDDTDPCVLSGPVEEPEDGDENEPDPSADATVGPDGASAEASAAGGEVRCDIAPPEDGDEPAAPCDGEAPGSDELPEDDGDDGESTSVDFEGSAGEDGASVSVSDGESGGTCAVGPDYEGETAPCERHGEDDGDDSGPTEELPDGELPEDELPEDELPDESLPAGVGFF